MVEGSCKCSFLHRRLHLLDGQRSLQYESLITTSGVGQRTSDTQGYSGESDQAGSTMGEVVSSLYRRNRRVPCSEPVRSVCLLSKLRETADRRQSTQKWGIYKELLSRSL